MSSNQTEWVDVEMQTRGLLYASSLAAARTIKTCVSRDAAESIVRRAPPSPTTNRVRAENFVKTLETTKAAGKPAEKGQYHEHCSLLFSIIDADNSGFMSIEELHEVLKAVAPQHDRRALRAWFSQNRGNAAQPEDAALSLNEFVACCRAMRLPVGSIARSMTQGEGPAGSAISFGGSFGAGTTGVAGGTQQQGNRAPAAKPGGLTPQPTVKGVNATSVWVQLQSRNSAANTFDYAAAAAQGPVPLRQQQVAPRQTADGALKPGAGVVQANMTMDAAGGGGDLVSRVRFLTRASAPKPPVPIVLPTGRESPVNPVVSPTSSRRGMFDRGGGEAAAAEGGGRSSSPAPSLAKGGARGAAQSAPALRGTSSGSGGGGGGGGGGGTKSRSGSQSSGGAGGLGMSHSRGSIPVLPRSSSSAHISNSSRNNSAGGGAAHPGGAGVGGRASALASASGSALADAAGAALRRSQSAAGVMNQHAAREQEDLDVDDLGKMTDLELPPHERLHRTQLQKVSVSSAAHVRLHENNPAAPNLHPGRAEKRERVLAQTALRAQRRARVTGGLRQAHQLAGSVGMITRHLQMEKLKRQRDGMHGYVRQVVDGRKAVAEQEAQRFAVHRDLTRAKRDGELGVARERYRTMLEEVQLEKDLEQGLVRQHKAPLALNPATAHIDPSRPASLIKMIPREELAAMDKEERTVLRRAVHARGLEERDGRIAAYTAERRARATRETGPGSVPLSLNDVTQRMDGAELEAQALGYSDCYDGHAGLLMPSQSPTTSFQVNPDSLFSNFENSAFHPSEFHARPDVGLSSPGSNFMRPPTVPAMAGRFFGTQSGPQLVHTPGFGASTDREMAMGADQLGSGMAMVRDQRAINRQFLEH